MNGIFTYRIGQEECKVTCEQLHKFADHIGLAKVCPDRWSHLLAFDIYWHFHHGTVTPEEIIREIHFLETDPSKSKTKPAEPFRGSILSGFLHKHYFTAVHLPKNLLNQISGTKFHQQLQNICGTDETQIPVEDIANKIAYAATHGAISDRLDANKLTGEWVVFKKHQGANYYLCLGKHSDDDMHLKNRIHLYCIEQFPF